MAGLPLRMPIVLVDRHRAADVVDTAAVLGGVAGAQELIVSGDTSRRHHKRVTDGFLLKADDLRETESWKYLNVEDFLYRCFEFKQADETTAAQIHGSYAAFQFGASLGDGHAVHRRCRPNL